MKAESPHHRRSIRLPQYDYSAPGAYFVTLVTQDRACLFGDIAGDRMELFGQGRIAEACWCAIPEHFPNVELGAYVVMPNHVHGILILHDRADVSSARRGTIYRAPTLPIHSPTNTTEGFQKPVVGSVPTIVRTYKAALARTIGRQFGDAQRVWQRNYYEHVIRDEADWNRIHLYIESNVLNWAGDEENQTG